MNEPVGRRVEVTATALEPVPVDFHTADEYVDLALINHPRLLALRQGRLVRMEQINLAWREVFPDLVLVGRVAHTWAPTRDAEHQSMASDPYNPTQSGGGLALQWKLDLHRRLAKVDQQRLAHRKARLLEEGERAALVMEIRKLHRELLDAHAMIDVQERAMRAARGWLAAEKQTWDGGLEDDMKELLRATESYYRRRVDWLTAIYEYNLAVAALSRAVGVDIARPPGAAGAAAAKSGSEADDAEATEAPGPAEEEVLKKPVGE
jgi:outer membrane protein TolC